MKQTFYSLISLLLLIACSSEAPYQDSPANVMVPLVISSIRIDSDVSTRATDIPLTEGTLGIFRTNESAYLPASFRYTGSEGDWRSDTPLTVGSYEAFVCAWFPYDYFVPTEMADLGRFPLRVQVDTPANDLAFLQSTGGIDNQHPTLNIRLTHAHALFRFILHRDITYKGEGVITGITFENDKLVDTEKIDIRDGSFSDQEIIGSRSLDLSNTLPAGESATLNILVPPQTFPDTRLSLQVDGKTLSGTFSGDSIGHLESGMSRTLDVTLRRNLELSVSVLPVDSIVEGEIIW